MAPFGRHAAGDTRPSPTWNPRDLRVLVVDDNAVNRTILDWGASYYTKLAMSAAGGRASDVAALHLSRLAAYAPGGLLDPWDLDLLAEFGVTEENFAPAVWRRAQHDGTVRLEETPGGGATPGGSEAGLCAASLKSSSAMSPVFGSR